MSYIPILYQSALEDIQYYQDKYSKQKPPKIIKDKYHCQIYTGKIALNPKTVTIITINGNSENIHYSRPQAESPIFILRHFM